MIFAHFHKESLIMATEPTEVKLKPHHAYRSWTTDWYDDLGKRRTKRFAREDEMGAREARATFRHWRENEWRAKDWIRNPEGSTATFALEHLRDEYVAHAQTIYVKRGNETSNMFKVRWAMDALVDITGRIRHAQAMYMSCEDAGAQELARHLGDVANALEDLRRRNAGRLPAAAIEGPHIAALRDALVWTRTRPGKMARTSSRGFVNDLLKIIQQAFTWSCTEKGKVPQATAWAVSMVTPLRSGRSFAREPVEITPVAWDVVDDTKRCCSDQIAAMIELQWLTGMRPEEVCIMRTCDIEAGGEVWIYRPEHHKTEHHGKTREIMLGPKAQKVLKPLLKTDRKAYLFSPAEESRKNLERQGITKTVRTSRPAGKVYTTRSYRQAIHRACHRAWPYAGVLSLKDLMKLEPEARREYWRAKQEWDQAHVWNPNQLRHAWATFIRKEFGIEDAAIGLGHSDINTAEIYAERDRQRAMDVARKVG